MKHWSDIDASIQEAAIAWHVRLESERVTDQDFEDYGRWMEAHPDHSAAYLRVEAFSADLSTLVASDQASAATVFAEKPARRFQQNWQALAACFAVLGLLAVGFAAATFTGSAAPSIATYQAAPDTIKTIILSDGSKVILGPGATMKASFSDDARSIAAFNGTGFFEVAKDTKRPFTVNIGDFDITVVGTQFEVVSSNERRRVVVAEGVVTVAPRQQATAKQSPIQLSAGRGIELKKNTQSLVSQDIAEIAQWRRGSLQFQNASLDEIVRRLNDLYGSQAFAKQSDVPDTLRFSGILSVSEKGETARRLTELMPLKLNVEEGTFVLSSAS